MTDAGVLEITQRSVTIALMLSGPILGVGLTVGLVVSVFQAATQIQEMTLTFVPKMIAVAGAIVVFGPWMLRNMVNFTTKLLISLPYLAQ